MNQADVTVEEEKSTADSNDDSLVHVVIEDEHEHADISDATLTPVDEQQEMPGASTSIPPIPQMMRRHVGASGEIESGERNTQEQVESQDTRATPVLAQPLRLNAPIPAPAPFLTGQPIHPIPVRLSE